MNRLWKLLAVLSLSAIALAIVVPVALASAARVATLKPVVRSYPTETGQSVPQVRAGTPVALATDKAVILVGSF